MVTLATVVAGVVLAHVVGYVVVYPVGGERAAHLRATGHGYWPVAVAAACACGLIAILLTAAAARRPGWPSRSIAGAIARLALMQMVVFTLVEVGERVTAAASPDVLLHSPEFVVGLALQIAVAAAAVLLLRGVAGIAAASFSRPAARRRVRPQWRSVSTFAAPSPAFGRRRRPRAPPLVA